jgi:hypothetical protein
MKDAAKYLLLVTLGFMFVWSAVHLISNVGLPPTWVHGLEHTVDSIDDASAKVFPQSTVAAFAKPRSNFNVLLGKQRRQEQAIQSLEYEVRESQDARNDTQAKLLMAQQKQNIDLTLELMQRQAQEQKEALKIYKDEVDELNRQKRVEEEKKTKPMPIILTAILGVFSLFVILSKKFEPEVLHLAIATITAILGFWLGVLG